MSKLFLPCSVAESDICTSWWSQETSPSILMIQQSASMSWCHMRRVVYSSTCQSWEHRYGSCRMVARCVLRVGQNYQIYIFFKVYPSCEFKMKNMTGTCPYMDDDATQIILFVVWTLVLSCVNYDNVFLLVANTTDIQRIQRHLELGACTVWRSCCLNYWTLLSILIMTMAFYWQCKY